MNASAELRARVAGVRYWYHTLELAPGVVTPGHFDLRGVVDRLPWPDLRGRRCLDVATFDGFYAFEMERRGAGEVVAIDIADSADLDLLPREVPAGFARGQEPVGEGFAIAKEQLGSEVKRVVRNVYDLSPDDLGRFDVVVCGALLQHLRDPLRALLAIRSVCDGHLLSVEHVDWLASLLWGHTPMLRLVGHARTWTLPNVRGHRQMLVQTGFDVERRGLLGMPLGPAARGRAAGLRGRLARAVRRVGWQLVGGSPHPPFSVALARPAPGLQPLPD